MNKCKCGKLSSLTCVKKVCGPCCNDFSCLNHSEKFLRLRKKILSKNYSNYIQENLLETTSILHKTILPDTIINYILNEFINPLPKCTICCKKDKNHDKCEKCNENYCLNCILKKKFDDTHKLCKTCYPIVNNIHDIYKNVCDNCTRYDNDEQNYISCEICNKINCKKCNFIRYCYTCFLTLNQNLINIDDEEDYSRCDICNNIEKIYEMNSCYDCGNYNCYDCHNYCRTCEVILCNECSYNCYHCEKTLCDNCTNYCNNCDNFVCKKCYKQCVSCDNGGCTNCKYECNDCNNHFCLECSYHCNNCENFICEHCNTDCKNCEISYCKDCILECNNCEISYCENCSIECNYCEKLFCENCTTECKSCNENVCLNCHNKLICK